MLSGCDLTSPNEEQFPIDLALDFCADNVPVWFAHQNQMSTETIRIFPDADGTFRFTATNRVIIGLVWQDGSDYHTEIISATNQELEAFSGTACLEERGIKTVNGTVAGFGAGQIAVVGMNFASAALQSGNTSYSLTNLADRPLDLVASRQNVSGSARQADRIVIRRTQNVVNNGTIPLIDFSQVGGEVAQAATADATVSGILSGEVAYLQNKFFSQLETSHSLSFDESVANGTLPFAAVPTEQLAAGDYQDLILLSVNAAEGGVRGAETFFRAPLNRTLALGPELADPTVVVLPYMPYLRLGMDLPLQTSYDEAVSVAYRQHLQFSVTSVSLFTTLGYVRSTFGTWRLDIPALSGADGFQDAWGLRPDLPVEWTVTGFGGRSELLFGAKPEDGETVRYAVRQSEPLSIAPLRALALSHSRAFSRRRR